jgi:UDP-2-acetamido-2-deoxy-ribo-hexuluronate aminotransferase
MQFIDLKAQYSRIQKEVDARMKQVLEHGQFIMGPEVKALETCLAAYVGVKHCITISSGTDALMIALMALGVGHGDEVITTPFSFFATASMIKILGAKPVFVDIDPQTYNINPALIEQAITPKTKAIIPVNLYGQCADYDAIATIATKYGLAIVEDAAQSFGATYKAKQSCALGTISCTSFFPSKPLGCYGDGGACFTDDDALAIKMAQLRNHGQDGRYHHVALGINGRLDTLQAAILLVKMDIFADELQSRTRVARQYDDLLKGQIAIPYIEPHCQSVYAQYTIRVQNRDAVAAALAAQQIPTAVHYPVPINKQPAISRLNGSSHEILPHSDAAAKEVLSLPFHPYLEAADIQKIAEVVLATHQSHDPVKEQSRHPAGELLSGSTGKAAKIPDPAAKPFAG